MKSQRPLFPAPRPTRPPDPAEAARFLREQPPRVRPAPRVVQVQLDGMEPPAPPPLPRASA
jgi:hypothetical protein